MKKTPSFVVRIVSEGVYEIWRVPKGRIYVVVIKVSKRREIRIDARGRLYERQKRHAHIHEKGRNPIVVNEDGTGSHGTKKGDHIPDWAAEVLRGEGFSIPIDNVVRTATKRRHSTPDLIPDPNLKCIVIATEGDGEPRLRVTPSTPTPKFGTAAL